LASVGVETTISVRAEKPLKTSTTALQNPIITLDNAKFASSNSPTNVRVRAREGRRRSAGAFFFSRFQFLSAKNVIQKTSLFLFCVFHTKASVTTSTEQ
jgi:hypothetical protein